MEYRTVNDVVYVVANRAKILANYKMSVLRKIGEGYPDCEPFLSRGGLIEKILLEEFIQEFPEDIAKEGDSAR